MILSITRLVTGLKHTRATQELAGRATTAALLVVSSYMTFQLIRNQLCDQRGPKVHEYRISCVRYRQLTIASRIYAF